MKYSGVVQQGRRYGSSLGFPTANIPFRGEEGGIFAGRVQFGGEKYDAAVYADQAHGILEVHIPGYTGGDLYGVDIDVELLKKIREDKRFDSEEDLKAAIASDIRAVKEYFTTEH